MAQKSTPRHKVRASDEFNPTALSRGQLVQLVIDLWKWLDNHRAKVDCERELVTIHHDTVEREREAVTQVNYQLLTLIEILPAHKNTEFQI